MHQTVPNKRKLITLLIAIGFVIAVFYFVIYKNLAPDDSGALFGGRIEYSYPSAGYLITEEKGGQKKTCGYTAINGTTAVTASHCVDNASTMYMGTGEFDWDIAKAIKIDLATQKDGWINSKTRADDFAVLKFTNTNNKINSYAEIASPRDGCLFRVVAYGRTEDAFASQKLRKSAVVCASDISQKTFQIKGSDSGICFGDSGSPVYYNNTNKIVGVVASIIKENPNDADPCKFGNTAIVVRADYNKDMVDANTNVVSEKDPSVSDQTTLQVINANIFDRLGLPQFDKLNEQEKNIYLLLGVVVLLIIVLVSAIIILARGGKQDQQLYKTI